MVVGQGRGGGQQAGAMSYVWTCLCVWTCMCVGREGVFVTECNTGAGKHRGTNAQWWHSKEIATTYVAE